MTLVLFAPKTGKNGEEVAGKAIRGRQEERGEEKTGKPKKHVTGVF